MCTTYELHKQKYEVGSFPDVGIINGETRRKSIVR